MSKLKLAISFLLLEGDGPSEGREQEEHQEGEDAEEAHEEAVAGQDDPLAGVVPEEFDLEGQPATAASARVVVTPRGVGVRVLAHPPLYVFPGVLCDTVSPRALGLDVRSVATMRVGSDHRTV